MTADLRQALDKFDRYGECSYEQRILIQEAARSWLNLQQGDEKIVEKVAEAMFRGPDNQMTLASASNPEYWLTQARRVLAAIVGEDA